MKGSKNSPSIEKGKLHVEYRPVATIIPYERNSRTHSDNQIKAVGQSISEFGFTNPILIGSDNVVIAGHARLRAAKKLDMKEVPVIVLDHLSQAQRKALIIADNKLAMNAGWDDETLAAELKLLEEQCFDLTLLGFDDKELAELLKETTSGLTDEDETTELTQNPVSVAGDVWICGKHRIGCGDSTKLLDVGVLLNGVTPGLMVTDPPYGVEYDAQWRDKALGGKAGGRATGKVSNDENAHWSEAWLLFPGDVVYVWHADRMGHIVAEDLIGSGFEIRAQIIWAKSQFVLSRGHYHSQHEPCWYAVKRGKTGHWSGDRTQSTIWSIDKPQKSETGHSTQKPVECMRRPILNNSSPGQAVYDPFLGSGTTVIACETEGRVAFGMELNAAYVDMAVERWQAFTGNEAKLDVVGRTFADMASERRAMVA